jgi:phosphatidate cytidylyltransferase
MRLVAKSKNCSRCEEYGMTDNIWRNDDGSDPATSGRRPGRFESQMDDFDESEFGGPLFGDDSGGVTSASPHDPTGEHTGLSFGDDATGPLPHWTEPPTGEIPKIDAVRAADVGADELDVWSTFTSESPVWKEGDSVDAPSGSLTLGADGPADPTGELRWEDDPSDGAAIPIPSGADDIVAEVPPREPQRITIGTDPSGMPRRPDPVRRGSTPQRPPSSGNSVAVSEGRNLPVAIAVGVALAAAFLALTIFVGPLGALGFVVVMLAVAGIEYFGKVTEKGYRPAVAPGVLAIVCAPLAAYWVGEQGIVLVIVLAFLASACSFITAPSIESGPMPNMAITTLGVVWIGVLGSYAGLLLDFSNGSAFGGSTSGTDTLVILAIGVVANDVGAFFVGSAWGKTPLRGWISPAKSVEGWLGGTVLTLLVMVIISIQDLSDTWISVGHLLTLGLLISVLAPLGDLTESMFKRNLDVKDFGTVIAGHGGVLDRFDGFLFTLPAAYYLFSVVEPWLVTRPA